MPAVKLEWQGEVYVIPEDRVFDAVDEMENHVTLASLSVDAQQLRMGRLSKAFSVLLTHAGAPNCEPQEVRKWMADSIRKIFEGAAKTGRMPTQEQVHEVFFGAVVKALSEILMDGAPPMEEGETSAPGKQKGSSKKRSS